MAPWGPAFSPLSWRHQHTTEPLGGFCDWHEVAPSLRTQTRGSQAYSVSHSKPVTVSWFHKIPLAHSKCVNKDTKLLSLWNVCVCVCVSPHMRSVASNSLWSMECSSPGSSVHGILQARMLEWVAISYSRESSWPKNQTHILYISCTGRPILYHCTTWEILEFIKQAMQTHGRNLCRRVI